jgi:hypothetical protein
MTNKIHNNYYENLLALRRDLRIDDYRDQMDRLEAALKKEKLEAYREKQYDIVTASKVDVYI